MNRKPFLVTFAGVPGSGKSAIAMRLSLVFDLPVLSNNVIRVEVHEDTLEAYLNQEKFEALRDERADILFDKKSSFIYDTSVDRRMDDIKKLAEEKGYRVFVISMDLSDEFIAKLQNAKEYHPPEEYVKSWSEDHQKFLTDHQADTGLGITDENFSNRQRLAEEAVRTFITQL